MALFKVSSFLTLITICCAIVFTSLAASGQVNFDNWFENKTLRIDYVLAGNNQSEQLFLERLSIETYWSGSHNYTIDTLCLGSHRIEVRDEQTDLLLFATGFSTLFQEWQTIEEAQLLNRAFEQVTRIPLPKRTVNIQFFNRDSLGHFAKLYKMRIDPRSVFIEKRNTPGYNAIPIVHNGDPNSKLDIVFIAEGYTQKQMEKFRADAKRFSNYLFSQPPFDKLEEHINIWGIESISENEGPSNPAAGIWNNTAVSSTFNTFGISRYLTTFHFKQVMDVASNAPGDFVCIMVNSSAYGGGGIYNHYITFTSNHELSEVVFLHELGHGLAGLGDEYYTSDVSYQDYYPTHIEPWEPNLTTLVNFESKWSSLLDSTTPIPTPQSPKYENTIGVFEGGGYVSQGVYRPAMDCRMKSNTASSFCTVCREAIRRVVMTYTR